jgi:propanol-preferring alcohol dehydrogenase
MKAAVVHRFEKPLSIEDVPIPEPGAEQALVRIEACGLCHTDVHAARGEWPVTPRPPFIPGHEGIGIIERVGPGDQHGLQVGMRVALPWLGYACGDCRFCNSGRENLCQRQLDTGYSINGALAEYAVGFSRHLVRVPEGIDPRDAAPLTCAGVTTYKAVKVSGASPASLVAIFGVGGLGHLAVQYAKIAGAQVVAVDRNDERLRTAQRLGADHIVNNRTHNPVAAIEALGGATEAIVTADDPRALVQALLALAPGGTLVCVGLPGREKFKVPIYTLVTRGLTIIGSIVGTHQDLIDVFELHRRGRTVVERRILQLDDVNRAMDDLLDGSAGAARTVFCMAAEHASGRPELLTTTTGE